MRYRSAQTDLYLGIWADDTTLLANPNTFAITITEGNWYFVALSVDRDAGSLVMRLYTEAGTQVSEVTDDLSWWSGDIGMDFTLLEIGGEATQRAHEGCISHFALLYEATDTDTMDRWAAYHRPFIPASPPQSPHSVVEVVDATETLTAAFAAIATSYSADPLEVASLNDRVSIKVEALCSMDLAASALTDPSMSVSGKIQVLGADLATWSDVKAEIVILKFSCQQTTDNVVTIVPVVLSATMTPTFTGRHYFRFMAKKVAGADASGDVDLLNTTLHAMVHKNAGI